MSTYFSIVIPIYHEAQVLPSLYRRLTKAMEEVRGPSDRDCRRP